MRRAPILPVMLLAALAVVAGCEEEKGDGPKVEVPSGRKLSLIDVITNAPGPSGATARFRFLAPGLASEDADAAAADMQALCDSFALPRTDGMVPAPQQIVIVVSDRALPFGEAAPEAVQFFESYRIEGTSCIWEMF